MFRWHGWVNCLWMLQHAWTISNQLDIACFEIQKERVWVAHRLHLNASVYAEALTAPHLLWCGLSDCWEENVGVIPQNFRCHENAWLLVDGAIMDQLFIWNKLTSLHMKPVRLYLALREHCLCLAFVFICSHTLFLSSSMWPNPVFWL